jgi:hypothetical protein
MRRPKSLEQYQILRASQALGGHYFSIGFHYFYTQFYTQSNAEKISWFRLRTWWRMQNLRVYVRDPKIRERFLFISQFHLCFNPRVQK